LKTFGLKKGMLLASVPFFLSLDAAAGPNFDQASKNARAILGSLVAADTTNPPGNEARAVEVGVKRLKELSIPFEVTDFAPKRQNLVARLQGSQQKKPVLILAHLDVVGTTGQKWHSDPHQMIESDGFLKGRGVFDDLGMAAVGIEVLALLKEQNVPLKRDLILAWTGDEESGGAGIQYLLQNHRKSIEAEFALNEGGGLHLKNSSDKLDRVTLQNSEKTYNDFEVVARGIPGHSSVPLKKNAIYRLSEALARLNQYQFPLVMSPTLRRYLKLSADLEDKEMAAAMKAAAKAPGNPPPDVLKVLESKPYTAALLRTTCVATLISGGTRENVLPSEARANINCRILPEQSVQEVQQILRKVLTGGKEGSGVEVSAAAPLQSSPASPLEGPLVPAVEKVLKEMGAGAVPIVPTMSLGATDGRYMRLAGIPTYGLNPIATSKDDHETVHGPDERIPIASVRRGVEFLYRLILELNR
jgi:acetylornithine deacetylase/succinyl-diaminopimelate desuccinylase-like protein